jgi:adenine-specific DNA-methyltransferase
MLSSRGSGGAPVGGSVKITEYHAKYFAHVLRRRSPSDSLEKLGASLMNATVDLNPHQIDAALFAFRSPLSRGALLADEVGLGKTIEAGLIISQLWAERRRRILAIVPTTLRNQWMQELQEKFFIPTTVLDARTFGAGQKAGATNPFDDAPAVVVCSYHFARAKADAIQAVAWDLVVVDEAHRLGDAEADLTRISMTRISS